MYGSLRETLAPDVPSPLTKYSIPEWDYGGIPAMTPYQAPSVTEPQDNVNFFTSDVLPLGTYSLWINVTTASPDAPFYLDYIAVETPGAASVPVSSHTSRTTSTTVTPPTTTTPPPAKGTTVTVTSSPPSSSTSSSLSDPLPTSHAGSVFSPRSSSAASSTSPVASVLASAVTIPGSTVTLTPSQASTESGAATLLPTSGFLNKSSFPVGAIVGTVVGGVLLLLVALLALCTCIRRRRSAIPADYDYGIGTIARKGESKATFTLREDIV